MTCRILHVAGRAASCLCFVLQTSLAQRSHQLRRWGSCWSRRKWYRPVTVYRVVLLHFRHPRSFILSSHGRGCLRGVALLGNDCSQCLAATEGRVVAHVALTCLGGGAWREQQWRWALWTKTRPGNVGEGVMAGRIRACRAIGNSYRCSYAFIAQGEMGDEGADRAHSEDDGGGRETAGEC